MEKCIIYLRESPPSMQATDVSFDDQEKDTRKYAGEKGYAVVKVYRESHSGADLIDRPLIWQAIDDIQHGDASILLVRNFDRLARRPDHQGVILFEVEEKHGGRVEAALDQIDRNDPMARMTRDLLAVVANGERINSVARMERGKRHRAERGHLPGMSNPLFGYRWSVDAPGERTAYEIDPETGPIVQRVFRLVLSGHGLRAIARLFNAEGVPTPSQFNAERGHIGRRLVGSGWSTEQIRRMVADRTYTGEGIAYRWVRVKTKNGKRKVALRPVDDMKRLSLAVPALIDVATWDAAQRAFQAKETNGRPPHDREATWLRLHVYCGVCGDRMHVRRTSEGHAYEYKCRNRPGNNVDGEPCKGGNFAIRAHLIDQDVYEALAWLLMRREWVTQLMLKRLGTDKTAALVAMAEAYQAQLADKRDELETTRRRARQTKDDTLAGQFMRDAEQLTTEIANLEGEYADARDKLDNFNAGNAWIDSTLKRIYEHNPIREIPTPDDVRAFPYEDRRVLLASSGLRAEVYPVDWTGERRIGYHVGPAVHVSRGPNGETVETVEPEAPPKRVQVFFDWELDQQEQRAWKQTQPS